MRGCRHHGCVATRAVVCGQGLCRRALTSTVAVAAPPPRPAVIASAPSSRLPTLPPRPAPPPPPTRSRRQHPDQPVPPQRAALLLCLPGAHACGAAGPEPLRHQAGAGIGPRGRAPGKGPRGAGACQNVVMSCQRGASRDRSAVAWLPLASNMGGRPFPPCRIAPQGYTQFGGQRPFGVSLLYAGWCAVLGKPPWRAGLAGRGGGKAALSDLNPEPRVQGSGF
jgi:hypothetical protein